MEDLNDALDEEKEDEKLKKGIKEININDYDLEDISNLLE